MYAVILRFSISQGPCNILDIVDVGKVNEHQCKISIKSGCEGRILTRGQDSAEICAHNVGHNLFDFNCRDILVEDFVALYRTRLLEYFTISLTKNKAVLAKINMETARKVYTDLPTRLFSEEYIFNPDNIRDTQVIQANSGMKEDLAKSEADRIENLKGPHDRFLDDSEVSARRN